MPQPPPKLLRHLLAEFEGFRDLGMWHAARAVLERVPAELMEHPDVLLGRLDVLVGTNAWNEALRLAEQVASLIKNQPEAWYDIACAHSQQGNIQAAMDAVKQCVSLNEAYSTRVLQEPLLAPIWSMNRL